MIYTPDFLGGPLLRAAIYGRTGQHGQAQSELAALAQICPRFRQDYRELMRRLFFQPAYVDEILQGLRQAGFP